MCVGDFPTLQEIKYFIEKELLKPNEIEDIQCGFSAIVVYLKKRPSIERSLALRDKVYKAFGKKITVIFV